METAQHWEQVAIPETPPAHRDGFVAHSVTLSTDPAAIFDESYGWNELRNVPLRCASQGAPQDASQEGAAQVVYNHTDTIIEVATELFGEMGIEPFEASLQIPWSDQSAAPRRVYETHPASLQAPSQAIVVLNCGTVVLLPMEPSPDEIVFAGFTPDESPDNAVEYRIPVHRFPDGVADGRRFLEHAAKRLGEYEAAHPAEAPFARRALAAMTLAGYPHAGVDDADANVVGIFRRDADNRRIAVVELHGFGYAPLGVTIRVVVLFDQRHDLHYETLRRIADVGRDMFRNDFLMPSIAHVRATDSTK